MRYDHVYGRKRGGRGRSQHQRNSNRDGERIRMYGARRVRGKKETRGRDTKTTWKKRGEPKYKIGSYTHTRESSWGLNPQYIFSSRRTNAIQQQQYRHEEAGWKPCLCSSAHIVTPSRPLRPKRVCASVVCVCVAHLFTSSQIFAFRVRARRGTKQKTRRNSTKN